MTRVMDVTLLPANGYIAVLYEVCKVYNIGGNHQNIFILVGLISKALQYIMRTNRACCIYFGSN